MESRNTLKETKQLKNHKVMSSYTLPSNSNPCEVSERNITMNTKKVLWKEGENELL